MAIFRHDQTCWRGTTTGSSRLAITRDGEHLAVAGDGGTIHIWDIGGSREINQFEGHDGTVHALAYSPKGEYLVSASQDKTVRVLGSQDGQACATSGLSMLASGRRLTQPTARFWPRGEFRAS